MNYESYFYIVLVQLCSSQSGLVLSLLEPASSRISAISVTFLKDKWQHVIVDLSVKIFYELSNPS